MTDPHYSPVSRLAVASAVFGFSAIAGLFAPEFALVAVAGMVTGIIALAATRRYDLSGHSLARTGTTLSVAFALLTPAWYAVRFKIEAPRGYERVDFASLNAEQDQRVGKKVCLKGYALPPRNMSEMTSFVLSADGDRRRLESAVLVRLPAGETWEWQYGAIAVSGTLIPNTHATADPESPRLMLQKGSVRQSRTRFGLAPRTPGQGC